MIQAVRILFLEDLPSDAEIVQRELKKAQFPVEIKWVQTSEQYKVALFSFSPDIVISDHSLQGFTSVDAFKWLRESGLDIPFILVTGTVSEDFAVMMMKAGVSDYLLKDRPQRLSLAVANALEKWRSERDKRVSMDLLSKSEKRFRGLIENGRDMIGVTDESFNLTYISPSYVSITGRTFEEGQRAGFDFIHPDDRESFFTTFTEVAATPGHFLPLSFRLKHKNGHYIWMEGSAVNNLKEDAINGIIFNLRDVTLRKETEDALLRSKAHISAIIENSNVSIYSIDRQFRYISFNNYLKNSVKQAYGLDISVGDPVFDFLKLYDPKELPGWEKVYTEAFTGKRVEFEKEFQIGEYYACVSFAINPIVEGDKITGLSCFGWDITNQKLAAKKLIQSEARFRALIENNHDAIVMRGADRHVVYSSPSVKRLLGYSPDEAFDPPYEELIHPDDQKLVMEVYKEMMLHPNVSFPLTMRVRRKDGTYLWSEGVMTNMLENENVKGLVSNFRDISERKENELQREKMTLDLIERNQNLEQYAYIVSHNLRGPVANILGVSNLIETTGISDNDREKAMQYLFSSTKRLDEVLRDLNRVLELRQSVEQKEDVDLERVVNEVVRSIPELVRESMAEVKTNFNGTRSVSTVKSYLYSIFYNLITNAIKYRQEHVSPIIQISAEKADGRVKLKFADNGLGIDLDAYSGKLFGLYQRFHHEHAEGKGLGLFMTKTQVEALGGKISVESKVNVGTMFTIEL